jgi:CDP-diacylglycerol--glycerol-3-phosphate 3-phosphatidyltransferase
MISVYNIKPKFQQLMKPVMEFLHRKKFTPNHVTLLALFGSILTGGYVYLNEGWSYLVVVPLYLFIRMALNAIDGMMARAYNQQSPLGEVLNELGDVLADLAIFYPLLIKFGIDKHPNLLVVFIALMIINEFVGVLGKAMGGARRYDGPMGKSDRALFFGLLCVVVFLFPMVLSWIYYLIILVVLAMLLSTITRIKNSLNT